VEQLEQARAEVESLAQDPMASQAAAQDLEQARGALQRANEALADKRPVEEIAHHAYVAERHAEIGKARIDEMQSRQQIAQGEAERNRVLLEARESEAQAQAQRAQQAQQAAMTAQEQLEAARRELSDLQAKQTERGMVLTLGDVLFDTNKSTLKPGAMESLDRLANYLSQNDGTRIIIEGHTDAQGSETYNEELSRRRAQAVADALVTRGVPSSRFEVIGRGETTPVANNASAAGRQQNRRVEIAFSDQSGQFAQGANAPIRR
jgi:outer membrane protein OmpA-like peptidoglycan-associated protein